MRMKYKKYSWKLGTWYTEFDGVQITDYICFLIFCFPMFVIRKYLYCHSEYDTVTYSFAICGISFSITRSDGELA